MSSGQSDSASHADYRNRIAYDLVVTEVLAQEAVRHGIPMRPEVQAELDIAKKTLFAQLMVQELMKSIVPDDASLRQIYDARQEAAMYRFKIWSAETKERAEDIKAALLGDGPDPEGGMPSRAEETPWVMIEDVAPELRSEVRQLKPDGVANTMLEKGQAWQVVQLIGKNVIPKESFELERDLIRAQVVEERVQDLIADLVARAEINVNPLYNVSLDKDRPTPVE